MGRFDARGRTAPFLIAAVAATLVLLTACSESPGDAPPGGSEAAPEYCAASLDQVEIERRQLRAVDQGGPLLDRDLSASRSPTGDLCLQIVTDHADPGSTVLSYRIVVRRGGQEWRTAGEDPSGQPPLLVDGTGCVTATGTLVALGQGGRTYRYRAHLQAACDDGPP
jgi:hypothetical protein